MTRAATCLVALIVTACGRSPLSSAVALGGTSPVGDDAPGDPDDPSAGESSRGEADGSDGPPPPVECERGGQIRWRRQLEMGDVGRAEALTIDDDGNLYVAGAVVQGENRSIAATAFDNDGDALWQHTVPVDGGSVLGGGSPLGSGVAAFENTLVVVGYRSSDVDGAYFSAFDSAGGLLVEDSSQGVWYDVASIGDGTFVRAGYANGDPGGWRLERLETAAEPLWSQASASFRTEDDVLRAVASDGERIYAAGRFTDLAWVGAFDLQGTLLWGEVVLTQSDPTLTGSRGLAVAADATGVYVGGNLRVEKGYPGGSYLYNEAFVAAFTTDGLVRWRWTRGPDELWRGDVFGIAVLPGGDIVAVGAEGHKDDEDGLFAARFSADGELRWHENLEQSPQDPSLYYLRAADVVADGDRIVVVANDWSGDAQQVSLLELCP